MIDLYTAAVTTVFTFIPRMYIICEEKALARDCEISVTSIATA